MKVIALIGRILFSAIFITKSFEHFSSTTIAWAAKEGVPYASTLVPIAGVVALIGGLSILFGYKARFGAWLLIIFLIPTTIAMHKFWTADSVFAVTMHQYCFMKNVSMLGAACLIAYFGAGPISFDSRNCQQ
ncbi:MAG: hypothetical protein SP1CHLAM54_10180 [Chlamydiia bacterium]|nr:hypothetical protein [Chlamydiia bacterium]MCH9615924.1 hypothetical protein [Chlamydiia bacterium]MCH9628673.1 hypothetical protein [Chlamydiia bacterium]